MWGFLYVDELLSRGFGHPSEVPEIADINRFSSGDCNTSVGGVTKQFLGFAGGTEDFAASRGSHSGDLPPSCDLNKTNLLGGGAARFFGGRL